MMRLRVLLESEPAGTNLIGLCVAGVSLILLRVGAVGVCSCLLSCFAAHVVSVVCWSWTWCVSLLSWRWCLRCVLVCACPVVPQGRTSVAVTVQVCIAGSVLSWAVAVVAPVAEVEVVAYR